MDYAGPLLLTRLIPMMKRTEPVIIGTAKQISKGWEPKAAN
jgi:hypothetical protein